MFEARLDQGTMWKKIVEAINKEIVNEATFDCSKKGITLQGMDTSHICLVNLLLNADGFDYYRCDRNSHLGVKVEHLLKLLKCAGNDDKIQLQSEDSGDTLMLTFESDKKHSKFELKLIDVDQEHLGIPDQEYVCEVTMPSAEFGRICRDLTQIGETVVITCTKEGISFSCAGDLGSGNIRLTQSGSVDDEDAVIINLKEALTLNFSLRYLNYFTKATPLSSKVKLSLAVNVPLVAEYAIEDMGYIRYYLAPKLDDDE